MVTFGFLLKRPMACAAFKVRIVNERRPGDWKSGLSGGDGERTRPREVITWMIYIAPSGSLFSGTRTDFINEAATANSSHGSARETLNKLSMTAFLK